MFMSIYDVYSIGLNILRGINYFDFYNSSGGYFYYLRFLGGEFEI